MNSTAAVNTSVSRTSFEILLISHLVPEGVDEQEWSNTFKILEFLMIAANSTLSQTTSFPQSPGDHHASDLSGEGTENMDTLLSDDNTILVVCAAVLTTLVGGLILLIGFWRIIVRTEKRVTTAVDELQKEGSQNSITLMKTDSSRVASDCPERSESTRLMSFLEGGQRSLPVQRTKSKVGASAGRPENDSGGAHSEPIQDALSAARRTVSSENWLRGQSKVSRGYSKVSRIEAPAEEAIEESLFCSTTTEEDKGSTSTWRSSVEGSGLRGTTIGRFRENTYV
jgi:hypothetical protein